MPIERTVPRKGYWHFFIGIKGAVSSMKGRIALVTGGTGGIGTAICQQLAKQGVRVVAGYNQGGPNGERAKAWQAKQAEEGFAFDIMYGDVSNYESSLAMVEGIESTIGPIDILVNNAGLAAGLDTIQEGNIQDWDDMIDTNVKGLLYVTREILPQMIARKAGHIINIGSIAGHAVYPKGAVYCATKQAVNAITNGLRLDLLGTKIRVSTVDPGAVETNFSIVRFKGDTQRAAAVYEGMEALTPNDVADAVLYCATRPPHINISEVIIMPTDQASAGMISRRNS